MYLVEPKKLNLRRVSAEYSEVGDASSSRPSFDNRVSKPMSILDFFAKVFGDEVSAIAFLFLSSASEIKEIERGKY